MAQHEFGIMEEAPRPGQRFDRYEPEKYGCTAVEDPMMDPLLPALRELKVYWHTVDAPGRGIEENGVTLIPPESISEMLAVMEGREGLERLERLLRAARRNGKYVIHFGI